MNIVDVTFVYELIQPKCHAESDDITNPYSHLEQRDSWEVIVL